MDTIKDIIGHVIGDLAQKRAVSPSLVETWNRVAGSGSRPIDIKQGVLYVNVDSSARMLHLHSRKQSLIEAMKQHFPQITEIRWKVAQT